MNIQYHTMTQGSDEWLQARLGLLTASNAGLLVTPTGKVAKNDKVKSLAYELAAQRITKHVEESYTNHHMERGHIEEEYARELYVQHYHPVEQVGFITACENGVVLGYSPDGLVGDDGLIEIKSVTQKKQVKTIAADVVPPEHMAQMQYGMLVSGRQWCHFIQYSNGMHMYVQLVERCEVWQNKLSDAAMVFEHQIQEIVDAYQEHSKKLPVAERREYYTEDAMIGESE